jgi:transcriptional regulator with XRE-family HTH domain
MAVREMAKTRDPANEIVRDNLRKFRVEAELTTDQAAQASEVPVDNLRRYESGKSGIPASELRKLAVVYGHAMEDFYAKHPPHANLTDRPTYFLRTLPGMDVDEETQQKIQDLIDEANEANKKGRKPRK